MLCQRCKKNTATYHNIETVNGETFESHLCGNCYAELFADLHAKGGLLAGIFGPEVTCRKVCPVCRTSYSEYERTGLLGCASCYDVFKEELLPSIQRIQGRVEHVGKVEENVDELGLHRRLKTLQEELEVALREKRYAEAGKLNKRILEITKTLYGGDNNG